MAKAKKRREFLYGAPQVTYKKRNGAKFTMTYHSRAMASKSIKAYRSAGGKVLSTSVYGQTSKKFLSKSGLTKKGGKRRRVSNETW